MSKHMAKYVYVTIPRGWGSKFGIKIGVTEGLRAHTTVSENMVLDK